jgi:hypothetical protein
LSRFQERRPSPFLEFVDQKVGDTVEYKHQPATRVAVITMKVRLKIVRGSQNGSHNVTDDLDKLIRAAISRRSRVHFWYGGKERIAEPHDYGTQNGKARLLVYQIGGQSGSGKLPAWRLVDLSGISNLEILDKTFAGNRRTPSGKHQQWDEIFIRVGEKPEDEDGA